MKKKKATLTGMHVTTFSDQMRVSMWKFINSVWHRKWVVWHMNKWSHICSLILWTYRTGFVGNLKSFPAPCLCRAVHPTAWQLRSRTSITNCNSYIHMKYTTFAYETHKEAFCYVQQIWRKLSIRQRNETYSNTSHSRCVVCLSCMKHTRHAHIYIKWN